MLSLLFGTTSVPNGKLLGILSQTANYTKYFLSFNIFHHYTTLIQEKNKLFSIDF